MLFNRLFVIWILNLFIFSFRSEDDIYKYMTKIHQIFRLFTCFTPNRCRKHNILWLRLRNFQSWSNLGFQFQGICHLNLFADKRSGWLETFILDTFRYFWSHFGKFLLGCPFWFSTCWSKPHYLGIFGIFCHFIAAKSCHSDLKLEQLTSFNTFR